LTLFARLAMDYDAKVALTNTLYHTSTTVAAILGGFISNSWRPLLWHCVDSVPGTGHFEPGPCSEDDILWPQYTSGSTGDPKGVTVHNGAVRRQLLLLSELFMDLDLVSASWLPHFHDFGLLNSLLIAFCGGTVHFMSPLTFMQSPDVFLDIIERNRANHTCVPNFGKLSCLRVFK